MVDKEGVSGFVSRRDGGVGSILLVDTLCWARGDDSSAGSLADTFGAAGTDSPDPPK